jgi:hypothetical protein
MLGNGLLDEGLDLARIGDIGGMGVRASALSADRRDGLFECVGPTPGSNDCRAFASESRGNGLADAGPCAGDEGDASGESFRHCGISSWVRWRHAIERRLGLLASNRRSVRNLPGR